MSIGQLLSQKVSDMLGGHGDRGNKFSISIPEPRLIFGTELTERFASNGRDLNLICKSTSIPSISIQTADIWHRGRKFVVRDVTSFTNKWSVTFYNDSNYELRSAFEKWMFQIDRYTSLLVNSTSLLNLGYATTIKVNKIGENGSTQATYNLNNAFPTSISDIQLNRDNPSITEFTVEFTFSNWDRPEDNGKGFYI